MTPVRRTEDCSICYNPILKKEKKTGHGRHEFHKICLDNWEKTFFEAPGREELREFPCPLCRHPFPRQRDNLLLLDRTIVKTLFVATASLALLAGGMQLEFIESSRVAADAVSICSFVSGWFFLICSAELGRYEEEMFWL